MSVRVDVVATGELTRDLDDAADRQRLMELLDFDFDLCSALLCGEAQLLCSGVEQEQALAFATMMRECGVVSELRPHQGDSAGEARQSQGYSAGHAGAGEDATAPGTGDQPPPMPSRDDEEPATDRGFRHAADWHEGAEEAELIEAGASSHPRRMPSAIEPAAVASDNGNGVFEVPPRGMAATERPRWRRRWLGAMAGVLVVAIFGVWWGGQLTVSTEHAYIELDRAAVTASQSGEVAAIVARQMQPVKAGEPLFTVRGDTRRDGGVPHSSIEHAAEAGVLEELRVREGQRVQAGEVLGVVRLSGTASVLAYFDAATAKGISRGAAAKVVLDDYPDQYLSGIVDGELASTAGSERRGRVPVRIRLTGGELEQRQQQQLHSGMAARVVIRRRGFVD